MSHRFSSFTAHEIEDISQTGIYAIVNKVNGKFYVGSATQEGKNRCQKGFYPRWDIHIWKLNKNEHHCRHLQSSWNKYGSENFEFVIIHTCPADECIQYEQLYINFLCPHYNFSPTAGNTRGVIRSEEYRQKQSESRSKLFTIVSPNGEIVESKNITQFARERKLESTVLNRVILGKALHCKGWTKDMSCHALYKALLEDRGITFVKLANRWSAGHKKYSSFSRKSFTTKEEAIEYRDKAEEAGYPFSVSTLNWKEKLNAQEN